MIAITIGGGFAAVIASTTVALLVQLAACTATYRGCSIDDPERLAGEVGVVIGAVHPPLQREWDGIPVDGSARFVTGEGAESLSKHRRGQSSLIDMVQETCCT